MPIFKADRIQTNELLTTGSTGGTEGLIRGSSSLDLATTSSVDFWDSTVAISASAPGELNVVADNIYLSGTLYAGSVSGVSLDEAYDDGGTGAGAVITVDGQPVQIQGTGAETVIVFAVTGTIDTPYISATGSSQGLYIEAGKHLYLEAAKDTKTGELYLSGNDVNIRSREVLFETRRLTNAFIIDHEDFDTNNAVTASSYGALELSNRYGSAGDGINISAKNDLLLDTSQADIILNPSQRTLIGSSSVNVPGTDVTLYVSGSTGGVTSQGVSVFTGDTVVSGSLTIGSGSLTITSADIQFTSGSSTALVTLSSSNDLTFYDANAGAVSLKDLATQTTDTQNTLDQAYDEGGTGAGAIIVADGQPVQIQSTRETTLATTGTLAVVASDGDYMALYHDTSNAYITSSAGTLYIQAGGNVFRVNNAGTTVTTISPSTVFDQFTFGIDGAAGRQLVLCDDDVALSDFDHTIPLNPTLFIQSVTNPNTDNTQWLSLHHDTADAVIETGLGDLIVSGTTLSVQPGSIIQKTGDVGTDVGILLSGAIGGKDTINNTVTTFGGDMLTSGSAYFMRSGDNNGVGIGTVSPQTNLHVTGAIAFGVPASGSHISGWNLNENYACTITYESGSSSKKLHFIIRDDVTAESEMVGEIDLSATGEEEGFSCFIAGTMIRMFDGTDKKIEDVIIGDELLGYHGEKNKVLAFDRPLLNRRTLYAINDKNCFVTEEHPFLTTVGWKSIYPPSLKAEDENMYQQLEIDYMCLGQDLITLNGTKKLDSLSFDKKASNQTVYNFILDGNNTYYANGYLVHNKFHTDYADRRLQENIMPISETYIDKMLQLSAEQFDFNERAKIEPRNIEEGKSFGLDPKEVSDIFSDINMVWDDKFDRFQRISYWKFIPVLIECCKRQQIEIDELKQLLNTGKNN